MAVNFDEDLDQVERDEGGRGLRQRYEAALAELKDRDNRLFTFEARNVIEEHGLSLVKPEDLAGVSLQELEERARAVQAEKVDAQKDLARTVFAKRGLAGEELDKAVEEFIAPAVEGPPAKSEDLGAIRELGRVPGVVTNPTSVDVGSNPSNLDYFRAAEAQSAKTR